MIKILEGFKEGGADEFFQFLPILPFDAEFPQRIDHRVHDSELRLHQGPVQVKKDISVIGLDAAGAFESLAEICISLELLLLCKMHFPELLGVSLIAEFLIPELLTRDIKSAVSYDVKAVVTAFIQRNAVYLTSVKVLKDK
jgi:hypothetical protein